MDKPIKSLLLAAGLGTRLRPITLKKPKCLVEIGNKPLLYHWFEKLDNINIDSILINTHYLSKQVEDFLETQKDRNFKLTKIFEEELLGTAGTLIANIEFFKNSIGLLIHADNFSNFDLNKLLEAHKSKPNNCLLTMLTFNTDNPSNCGIVEVDEKSILRKFYEKVKKPPCQKANAAIYVFEDDFLKWLLKNSPNAKDFSTEIIPKLIGKIYTYHTDETYIDIGTIEALKIARQFAKIQNL